MKHLPCLLAVLVLSACAGSGEDTGSGATQPALVAELNPGGDVLSIPELAELLDQETPAWLRVGTTRLPIEWLQAVEDDSAPEGSTTPASDLALVFLGEDVDLNATLTVEIGMDTGAVVLAEVALMQQIDVGSLGDVGGEGELQEALCHARSYTFLTQGSYVGRSYSYRTRRGNRVRCLYLGQFTGSHVYTCRLC